MNFSESAWGAIEPIYKSILEHPFNQELTQGTLAKERFQFYMKQDSLYLVDFARAHNAQIIIRGLRAVSDFEYEFQLSGMNKRLNPEIETLFMTPSEEFANISSSLVREILSLGGDISAFVPASVAKILNRTSAK